MPEVFGKRSRLPLHGARIESYAMIGDLETAALVSNDGSIDWLCWPDFASPACFASLLGTEENGFWRIRPADKVLETRRRYRQDTLVVETTFHTRGGDLRVIDFMPPRGSHSNVVRIVECVRGKVKARLDLVLRFDYGLTVPWVTTGTNELRAIAGPNMVVLRSQCLQGTAPTLQGKDMRTTSEFALRVGESVCFSLTHAASNEELPPRIDPQKALAETEAFWTGWIGRCKYKGPYKEHVHRSLLTLKGMTYQPTGGIVAAPTTSLPEGIGGERNWDYRYCWLRDTAFTLLILMIAGYTDEAIAWRSWLLRAVAGSPDQIQTMYGIHGERRLTEWNAAWLPGYENSRPVRVGNAASEQFQLDVYGEVAAALNRTPDVNDDLRAPASELQAAMIDHVCDIWHLPDDGIWETRGGRQQFVHSKMMCWVALDRAIKNHRRFDGKGDIKRWVKNRDKLRKEIMRKGFNKRMNAFVQSYGSTTLDAANLRMVLAGFLPANDPRMLGTIDAVHKNLNRDGFTRRYDTGKSKDGLKGQEGTFLACSFWMVICLHLAGREAEAKELFERLLALTNDVGLLSEEYGTRDKRMLGNFPQALTHLGLVQAAFTLSGQWRPEPYDPAYS